MEKRKPKCQILNCTGHPVKIVNQKMQEIYTFRNQLNIRLKVSEKKWSSIEDQDSGKEIPIYEFNLKGVDNIPPKVNGTIYIVSSTLARTYPYRDDFYIPSGNIKSNNKHYGSKGLMQNPFLKYN